MFVFEADMPYTHLGTILRYCATQYVTLLENNIKQHYLEYIERYINVVFGKDDTNKCQMARITFNSNKCRFTFVSRGEMCKILSHLII